MSDGGSNIKQRLSELSEQLSQIPSQPAPKESLGSLMGTLAEILAGSPALGDLAKTLPTFADLRGRERLSHDDLQGLSELLREALLRSEDHVQILHGDDKQKPEENGPIEQYKEADKAIRLAISGVEAEIKKNEKTAEELRGKIVGFRPSDPAAGERFSNLASEAEQLLPSISATISRARQEIIKAKEVATHGRNVRAGLEGRLAQRRSSLSDLRLQHLSAKSRAEENLQCETNRRELELREREAKLNETAASIAEARKLLQERMQDSARLRERLSKEVPSTETQTAEVGKLLEQQRELKERISRFRQTLADKSEKTDLLQTRLEELRTEQERRLKLETKRRAGAIQSIGKERKTIERELKMEELKINTNKVKLDDVRRLNLEKKQALGTLQAELEELQRRTAVQMAEYKNKEKELSEEVRGLEGELNIAQGKVADLQKDLDHTQAEIQLRRSSGMAANQARLDSLRAAVEEREQAVQAREDEFDQAREGEEAELRQARDEVARVRKEATATEKEKEEAKLKAGLKARMLEVDMKRKEAGIDCYQWQ